MHVLEVVAIVPDTLRKQHTVRKRRAAVPKEDADTRLISHGGVDPYTVPAEHGRSSGQAQLARAATLVVCPRLAEPAQCHGRVLQVVQQEDQSGGQNAPHAEHTGRQKANRLAPLAPRSERRNRGMIQIDHRNKQRRLRSVRNMLAPRVRREAHVCNHSERTASIRRPLPRTRAC